MADDTADVSANATKTRAQQAAAQQAAAQQATAQQAAAQQVAAQQAAVQQTAKQASITTTKSSQKSVQDPDLKKAVALRKGVRVSIEKQIKLITDLLEENARATTKYEDLENVLFVMNTKEEKLLKANNNVISLMQDEIDIEIEAEEAEDYMDKIIITKANAARRMKELSGIVSTGTPSVTSVGAQSVAICGVSSVNVVPSSGASTTTVQTNSTSGSSSSQGSASASTVKTSTQSSTGKPKIKLPELSLPKFNGEPAKWTSFWNRFRTLIGESDIEEVNKFHYLISYLEGDAAKAVEELFESDNSYTEAVAILKDRFGNDEMIKHTHMNKLLDLKPIHDSDDLKALRRLLDTVEISLRSLKLAGVKTGESVSLLCPKLLRCLPKDMRDLFCQKTDLKSQWDTDEIVKFLRKQLESKEMSKSLASDHRTENKVENNRPNYDRQNSNKYQKNYRAENNNRFSASALNTQIEKNYGSVFCIFCNDDTHKTSRCTKVSLDRKRKFIEETNRCFNCLRFGHSAKQCTSGFRNCRICGKGHNMAVCEKNIANTKTTPKVSGSNQNSGSGNQNQNNSSQNSNPPTVANTLQTSVETSNKTVVLQTAKATAINPSQSKIRTPIRIVLDGGSQGTFVTEDIAEELKLPVVGEESYNVGAFMEKTPKKAIRKSVKVQLQNQKNPKQCLELIAVVVPFICNPTQCLDCPEIEEFMDRKGLPLADDSRDPPLGSSEISMLVGGDYFWKIAETNFERFDSRVVAQETMFGWVILGPTNKREEPLNIGNHLATVMKISIEQRNVDRTLKEYFEFESLGISSEKESLNESDQKIIENFKETTEFRDGRYYVTFPWKVDKSALPDNKTVAQKRIEGLVTRFSRDMALYTEYKAVIDEQIKLGIIEEVPPHEIETNKPGVYYLPQQPVKRDHSTTKLRVVNDASSKVKGAPSLNDCLVQGPNLNPDLLLLLLKFRTNKIAFVSDIEKAFLMVGLAEEERDSVRFLWVIEENGKLKRNEFKVYRMARVPFGVSSSPFLLAATIKNHLEHSKIEDERVRETINETLYVDDLSGGEDTVDSAFEVSKGCAELMLKASMKLRKWESNSPELKERWKNHDKSAKISLFQTIDQGDKIKILGMEWNTVTDSFSFNFSSLNEKAKNLPKTKRSVLSVVAQMFDPIGILSPFTVKGKLLFQELWKIKSDWDKDLELELRTEFETFSEDLINVNKIRVPRHYLHETNNEIIDREIHCFCDASEKAYATVVYIRYVDSDEKIGVAFITSKSKIAPLKETENPTNITVPKLELMGCLLGARIVNNIKGVFKEKINRVYMWTDSTVALYWIKGQNKSWKPFVANRTLEIRNLSDVNSWNHCPGIQNPADLPTRGITATELLNSRMWWEGAPFLKKSKDSWPNYAETPLKIPVNIDLQERNTVLAVGCEEEIGAHKIIDLNRYSSLQKILRITSYVFRFINKAKKLEIPKTKSIKTEELEKAEIIWTKSIQESEYNLEMRKLKENGKIDKNSKLSTLNPFLDQNGVMRVGGRLAESTLSHENKHPIIFPKISRYSKLLTIRAHEEVKHSGVNDTITQLREKNWIISGRQLAKSIVQNCLKCKRLAAKVGEMPTAPLPRERIEESTPFNIVGIDFAGPLLIKTKDKEIYSKAYICLYTCATTRAVHLELVSSLSTDEFLLALRRIIARRGNPTIVYSDNARTFKRADLELQALYESIDNDRVRDFFGNNRISWRYIVERAPWYGGWWERLVRSTKTTLKKILGKAKLNYSEMTTALTETEAIINSRPITYVYNDAKEPKPLSPAHFLIGKRINALPPSNQREIKTNLNRLEATKRLRYRQLLMERLWKRWQREYLLQLRSAHHSGNAKDQIKIKTGDVVLLMEDKLPKQCWKIGLVTETIEGRDMKIRSCMVKTTNGHIVRRPVQLIYNLEIQD